jgi:hypothetical protein
VSYPLNVFMHVLTLEEGAVEALHYGLFETPDEPVAVAQARSTRLLLERLPRPPARLLDVGAGLGTLLDRLIGEGYEADGITPDERQVQIMRARYGARARVVCGRFEEWETSEPETDGRPFDAVIFQESSQYIDSDALWRKVHGLTSRVLVLDEFALAPVDTPEPLHALAEFLACAARAGFRVVEERDLSRQASPTIDYFLARIPRQHQALVRDLGVSDQQIADLLASGQRYRALYERGIYGYRLLDLVA